MHALGSQTVPVHALGAYRCLYTPSVPIGACKCTRSLHMHTVGYGLMIGTQNTVPYSHDRQAT